MEHSLFRYIIKHSFREQVNILLLTAAALPFYYLMLQIPKVIINRGLAVETSGIDFDFTIFGHALPRIEPMPLLISLCILFLLTVAVHARFKYAINIYKGLLAERILRQLRLELCGRLLRFPLTHFSRVSPGEVIPMVTSEVEPLGGFVGDIIAVPALQGGLLFTALLFIFIQDPFMGLAAVALFPIQAVVITRLQMQVNRLSRKRVREVRRLGRRVGEAMAMAKEIQSGGSERYELDILDRRLGRIFDIRYDIYRKKYFIKFLNSVTMQLTPALFFLIGGYFVLQGDFTIGALVAVLAAYKDIPAPWKELLNYYQQQQDSRIKYGLIVSQFSPPELLPSPDAGEAEVKVAPPLEGDVDIKDLSIYENGQRVVDELSLSLSRGEHLAVTGLPDRAGELLCQALVGLVAPSGGSISMGGFGLGSVKRSLIARTFAYVDASPHFVTGTLLQNLYYGQSVDLAGPEAKDDALDILDKVRMTEDIFTLGLAAHLEPAEDPGLAKRLVGLRADLHKRIGTSDWEHEFAPFEHAAYNRHATIAENLFFGGPVGEATHFALFDENRSVLALIDRCPVAPDLIGIGLDAIREAVSETPEGSDVGLQEEPAERLAEYHNILATADEEGPTGLDRGERFMVLDGAIRLVLSRCRGRVPGDIEGRIVDQRPYFEKHLPKNFRPSIAFFDSRNFNTALTIEENLLFGRLAPGRRRARDNVTALMAALIDEHGLRDAIARVGLGYHVGVAGTRLLDNQRQKLAIARALLRRPAVLVACRATYDLNRKTAAAVIAGVRQAMRGNSILWVCKRTSLAPEFDRVAHFPETPASRPKHRPTATI